MPQNSMTRRKKLQSRWNGRRSSGPKSEAGRKASAQAALKHGAHSDRTLLPGEDPAEFDHLQQSCCNQFPGEARAHIVNLDWILDRLSRLEDELLHAEMARRQADPIKLLAAAYRSLIDKRGGLTSLYRHSNRLSRRQSQLLHQLRSENQIFHQNPPAENSPVSHELPQPIDKPAEPAAQPEPAPNRFVVLIWTLLAIAHIALRRISALLPHPPLYPNSLAFCENSLPRGTPVRFQTTRGFI